MHSAAHRHCPTPTRVQQNIHVRTYVRTLRRLRLQHLLRQYSKTCTSCQLRRREECPGDPQESERSGQGGRARPSHSLAMVCIPRVCVALPCAASALVPQPHVPQARELSSPVAEATTAANHEPKHSAWKDCKDIMVCCVQIATCPLYAVRHSDINTVTTTSTGPNQHLSQQTRSTIAQPPRPPNADSHLNLNVDENPDNAVPASPTSVPFPASSHTNAVNKDPQSHTPQLVNLYQASGRRKPNPGLARSRIPAPSVGRERA